MVRYPNLLFDADNTLFDFDAANHNAFAQVCAYCGIPYNEETYQQYETINQSLWAALNRGEVTKDFLVVERFRRFLPLVNADRDPVECNRRHLAHLGESTVLLPHALEVCRTLAQDHKLYIVTNAVASVQKRRLAESDIAPYITAAFISEDAGAAKPSTAYFDYVFAHVPDLTNKNALLIGDSPSSDIQGANNAGLPSCWYNPQHETLPDGIHADYVISDLLELYNIV